MSLKAPAMVRVFFCEQQILTRFGTAPLREAVQHLKPPKMLIYLCTSWSQLWCGLRHNLIGGACCDFWRLLPTLHGHSVADLFYGASCCSSVLAIPSQPMSPMVFEGLLNGSWRVLSSFCTSAIHSFLDLEFSCFVFASPDNLFIYKNQSR